MTDPNRPPLWREMSDAYCQATDSVASDMQTIAIGAAAEILAMRDHLFPGGRPDPVGVSLDCLTIWDELTAEAERAEAEDENGSTALAAIADAHALPLPQGEVEA